MKIETDYEDYTERITKEKLSDIERDFDRAIIPHMRKVLVGRQLVPLDIKHSFHSIGHSIIDNDDRTKSNVPIIKKDYFFSIREVDEWINTGRGLNPAVPIHIAYIVAFVEDKLILDGLEIHEGDEEKIIEEKGLLRSVVPDNIITIERFSASDINNVLLEKLSLPEQPYNATFNSSDIRNISHRYLKSMKSVLNDGNIYTSKAMPSGNVLLTPIREIVEEYNYFDLVIIEDMRNHLKVIHRYNGIDGYICEKIKLRVKDPSVIYRITKDAK